MKKMTKITNILNGYDNTGFIRYDDKSLSDLVCFDQLKNKKVSGVLKASWHVDGKLMQRYTEEENHVGVIAATRLGKTTSYAVPTILSFAKQNVKKGMIISDPKCELYRLTAETLKSQGYKVYLLNFRDYKHSECWNPLTPIFKKYRKIQQLYDNITVVDTANGPRNMFEGVIYEDQTELDSALDSMTNFMFDEVGNEIDTLAAIVIPTINQKDPYWENSACELLKAFIWAMLEDSDKEENPITEDTFSFSTILSLLNNIHSSRSSGLKDEGYFTDRDDKTSRAYKLAKNIVIENADATRSCIFAIFNTCISMFRDCAMRIVTSCNSFSIQELIDGPVAIFISYKDEVKIHYQIISLFVQDAYRYLIEQATVKPGGKLDAPFYFILDEFGNFPKIKDFETTISACAGRNIWFILIIQSYAQLDNVYGEAVSKIIRDNLNVHVFFGSNNPETLKAFSEECGKQTRISPLSALNGNTSEIENYQLETIPLIPVSTLSHFAAGECIVTEANSGYVLYSKLERYFMCKEFQNLPISHESDYKISVNPFDRRYTYVYVRPSYSRRSIFDD